MEEMLDFLSSYKGSKYTLLRWDSHYSKYFHCSQSKLETRENKVFLLFKYLWPFAVYKISQPKLITFYSYV